MHPRHDILVALHVADDDAYDRYRAEMTPLLEARGGFFRCDFRVSEVLKGAQPEANRVFVISFPDVGAKDAFFADPDYARIRREHFEPAVASAEIISAYERPAV